MMSQQPQMNAMAMGGPVGGAKAPPNNAATPSNSAGGAIDPIRRLNTAIYDYLLRNSLYEVARGFVKVMDIETEDIKRSPSQKAGQQPNGVEDGMDIDNAEIKNRPDDLPAPKQLASEGPFLQDWWCQFWEIWQDSRGNGKGQRQMMQYIGAQRQELKARASMMAANMDPQSMQSMRFGNNMMSMNGGMALQNSLKRAAMQNSQRNMTPQANSIKMMQAQMQGNPMERQGSQVDMAGPRSGSPNSGDAPSPKRQRLDGAMQQQMNQARPVPPGQMPSNQVGLPAQTPLPAQPDYAQTHQILRDRGIDPVSMVHPDIIQRMAMQPTDHQVKMADTYSKSLSQITLNQMNSNVAKAMSMPQNPAAMSAAMAAAAQGSPGSMDASAGDFYAANGRMPGMPTNPAAAAAAAAQNGGQHGNHALHDYQMQLMLLEQQNKKRLLMARAEQDNLTQPQMVANGQFPGGPPLSPSAAGDPSPNAGDMGRGTDKIGGKPGMPSEDGSPPSMMDPNMNPALRQQMLQNGGMMMRGPSSHPMQPGHPISQEQIQMMQQRNMLPNGVPWQPGQPPQGQMMLAQPSQQPPNMTPRQGNMAPPPAPTAGTQPSSPAQPPAPPTPSQASKPKPGGKKEAVKKGANKKNQNTTGATPATESEQPPTPTPATPITPMHQNSFAHGQNKGLPNGQATGAPAPTSQPTNGLAPPGQQQQQPPTSQPGAVQAPNGQRPPQPPTGAAPAQPEQDAIMPFGALDDESFGMNLESNDYLPDMLDIDFARFLDVDQADIGFDANLAFDGNGGFAGLEAADLGN